jgi:preprotein translocase subunit SecD
MWCAALAALVVVAGGCSSSAAKPAAIPTTTIRVIPIEPQHSGSAALQFRAVVDSGGNPVVKPCASFPPKSLPGHVVLPDRHHKDCYEVGPVLLNGTDVSDASAVYDNNNSQWVVNVRFANDDFVTKVAEPYIHRLIAIVLDGVVESAPVINPGITGRDVEITAQLSKAESIKVAASINGH